MLAAEVVEHHRDREHVGVVLKLLRERIRKPSEAAILHAEREVPTLMNDVEACASDGSPNATRFSIPFSRPGEYLLAALFGLTSLTGLLLA